MNWTTNGFPYSNDVSSFVPSGRCHDRSAALSQSCPVSAVKRETGKCYHVLRNELKNVKPVTMPTLQALNQSNKGVKKLMACQHTLQLVPSTHHHSDWCSLQFIIFNVHWYDIDIIFNVQCALSEAIELGTVVQWFSNSNYNPNPQKVNFLDHFGPVSNLVPSCLRCTS